MDWVPGQFEQKQALQTPRSGVPVDLKTHLLDWLRDRFQRNKAMFYVTIVWLQQPWRNPLGSEAGSFAYAWSAFSTWADEQPTRLLDVVHHLLLTNQAFRESSDDLEFLLDQANSLYRFRDDRAGLEERLPAGVVSQVTQAVADASSSVGKHLTAAWNAAYGYDKNTVHAYDEAIRAVETVMRQVLRPDDSIFQAISNAAKDPTQWKFALTDHRPEKYKKNAPPADGVEAVLDLMRLLAYGQHRRHGGEGSDPTEVEAKTAVMLAVTLVQLVDSGALERRQ